jgi:hypothetical protein
MEPTNKSPEMEAFLTRLLGKDRKDIIDKSLCMTCDSPNLAFHDALSEKEYVISGMCQDCQDLTFRCDDEDEG